MLPYFSLITPLQRMLFKGPEMIKIKRLILLFTCSVAIAGLFSTNAFASVADDTSFLNDLLKIDISAEDQSIYLATTSANKYCKRRAVKKAKKKGLVKGTSEYKKFVKKSKKRCISKQDTDGDDIRDKFDNVRRCG